MTYYILCGISVIVTALLHNAARILLIIAVVKHPDMSTAKVRCLTNMFRSANANKKSSV